MKEQEGNLIFTDDIERLLIQQELSDEWSSDPKITLIENLAALQTLRTLLNNTASRALRAWAKLSLSHST